MRVEKSDSAKKFRCTKPGGSEDTRRGRPKLWWCDEVDDDVIGVGCRNWRIGVESRQQWWRFNDEK